MEFISNSSNTNPECGSNSDNSDIESEEYINLEEMIKEQDKDKNNIYQIQIFDNELMIKLVGKEFYVPDVIIQENFGPDSKLSLYSCLYDEYDFNLGKEVQEEENLDINGEFFHPLIKLIEKNPNGYSIYSFAVKFKNLIFDKKFDNFELYIIQNKQDDEFVYTNLIDKNINSNNIVEKILDYYNTMVSSCQNPN